VNLPPSERSKKFNKHVNAVTEFKERLNTFKVCDPACGSGAFLIHVLEYLLKERLKASTEYARVTRQGEGLFEVNTAQEIREILSKNIYGVDINPSSIEITKLALWLHTAKPNQALCDLDENIRDGNSLVGPEFENFKQLSLLSEDKQEEINVFDWHEAFPNVFDETNSDGSGFDCVVGNPPYVKLQNFKKKYAEVADYLKKGKNSDGTPVYQSTQKGSPDLFLPFIEQSIGLLNDKGRMGFIAPSLWRYNEYGKGLCQFLHDGKYLDSWIDFGSYQVFDEATTYTALQFYSKIPKDKVNFVLAYDGTISDAPDRDDPNWCISYKELVPSGPWVFVPRNERKLIQRLQKKFKPLVHSSISQSIFVGVQTDANEIYHLKKIGIDKYLCSPDKDTVLEVSLEDSMMRPLVSGTEAKRYTSPQNEKYILFPYKITSDGHALYSQNEIQSGFPKVWAFFKSVETELRARGGGKVDKDDKWWSWVYPKNIAKQHFPKLMVAQTVPEMRVSPDIDGEFCLDNVRVNGILPAQDNDFYYLLGILNSYIVNWFFKRIAKPKDGGFFEANKQFIAPIPVPKATDDNKKDIGARAEALQLSHTNRQEKIKALARRYEACVVKKYKEDWLFHDVQTLAYLKEQAPEALKSKEKTIWAKGQRQSKLQKRLELIDIRLVPTATLTAELYDGELKLLIDGVTVVDKVFVDDVDGQKILTYWQHVARSTSITNKFKAQTLVGKLCNPPMAEKGEINTQIEKLNNDIQALDKEISSAENELNEIIFELYGLTDEERKMIQNH